MLSGRLSDQSDQRIEGEADGRATAWHARADGAAVRRRALVVVTSMLLAAQLGAPLSAAEPTLDQLNTVAALLEENNVQGLRDYLDAYPELAEGDTTLAVLLRRFLVESAAAAYFDFKPDLSDAVSDSQEAAGSDTPGEPAY